MTKLSESRATSNSKPAALLVTGTMNGAKMRVGEEGPSEPHGNIMATVPSLTAPMELQKEHVHDGVSIT